jgi:tetratricopeptide (TPR) repeat protein
MVRGLSRQFLGKWLIVAAVFLAYSQIGLGAQNSKANSSLVKTPKIQSKALPRQNKASKQVNVSPQPQAKTSIKPQAQPQTLTGTGLYLKAREYFAAGRYADAIKYAAAAQRRTPNSKLPSVLVAQSYYRLGITARAAKLFSQISPSDLPKEAVIDYILTMFAARYYREVIKAYPLVPDAHPYKDVVRFYTGVSLMQFKLYQKAQYFLRNARKIPASLKSQRRRLLSEIDDITAQERQGLFDQPQQYNYQSQQYYLPPPAQIPEAPQPILPGAVPGAAQPAVTSPPPPAGPSTAYSAKTSFGWNQNTIKKDYNGYRQEQSNEQIPSASVALGLKYLGKPRSFGGQPSFDLSLAPSYTHNESVTNSSSLIADAADPTAVQNVVTRTEKMTYGLANIYGVSGLYPVNDPVDVSAGYSEKHVYDKANLKNDAAVATINAKVSAELNSFKLDLSWLNDSSTIKGDSSKSKSTSTLKSSVVRNGENTTTALAVAKIDYAKPALDGGLKSVMSLDLSWSRNFEDFSLSVAGNKTDRERLELGAGGTTLSEMAGKLEGTYNLSFGVSVLANGTYQTLSNYVVLKPKAATSTDTAPEAMANGSAKKFSFTLKVSPASFASFNASYEYIDRGLATDEPTLQRSLLVDHWSEQTTTKIGLILSYSF